MIIYYLFPCQDVLFTIFHIRRTAILAVVYIDLV
jgi:uncharacterized membrane protein